MTDGSFTQIKSSKFPILPGEKQELVNDGTYGKALAQYLQARLAHLGYAAPFVCCEDWGWWVELKRTPFAFGVCIYSGREEEGPVDFVCTSGLSKGRKWSWKKFRFVETAAWLNKLDADLLTIFRSDPEVEIVGTFEEFPLFRDRQASG